MDNKESTRLQLSSSTVRLVCLIKSRKKTTMDEVKTPKMTKEKTLLGAYEDSDSKLST